MRWFRFALLICVATILQAGFLTNLNIKIDLLIILLVFFVVYSETSEAILCSFLIGFATDLIGHTVVGPNIISFGLFGTILTYLHRVIAIRKIPYQAVTIFIMGFLVSITANLLNSLKVEPNTGLQITDILKISFFSGIAGPFVFLFSAWWMRIKTRYYRRF